MWYKEHTYYTSSLIKTCFSAVQQHLVLQCVSVCVYQLSYTLSAAGIVCAED